MTKKMLIDASHAEETRVVVLDGSRLEDFDVETANRKQIKGNIYLAKVIRVEPSLQAAFVEYGGNRHGFLAFGEIHPDYYQIPVADRKRLLAQQAADAAAEEDEDDAPRPAQSLDVQPVEIISAPPPDAEPALVSDETVPVAEETADETPAEPEQISENIEIVPPAPPPEAMGGDGDDAADERERRQRQRFLRNYKIQDVIHRRQIMLIQVVKEERGNKGAALTTYLSLAGRFSVLMPNSPSGGGVSRKITSVADRRRLKEAMNELDVPDGMGLIVRTAGANRPKPEITRDCEYLLRLWDDIRDRTMQSTAPSLIYEEASLIKRTIRDVYTRDVEEILVDGQEGYTAARDFMRMLMPSHAKKVQLWGEGQPLFAKFQVEAQLDAMLNPIVQLRSGGYIVINQTEALVAIDVNSGRSTRERSIEDTALRTNLEAAEEAAKQLRMRDLAGLIVIDFIDMESRKNNVAVERRLKDALKNDRARIQVGSISHFGLMEMSRQRLRPSLAEASLVACPHCGGQGHVRSPESAALHILRAIEDEGAKLRSAEIGIFLPQDIALYLFNQKRDRIAAIEARYGMRVYFSADASLTGVNFRMEKLKPLLAPPPPPARTAPITAEQHYVAPETDEEDSEDEDAPKTGDTAEEGERKRRRRRRRGKRRTDGDVTATPVPGEEPVTADEAPPEPVAVVDDTPSEFDLVLAAVLGEPDDSAPTVLVQEPEAVEAEVAPKKRRSRGGVRRRKPAAGEEALITEDTPQPDIFAPVPDAVLEEPAIVVAEAAVLLAEPEPEPEAEPAGPVVKPIVIGADAPVVEKKRGWWRR
jgi:ribonuclease E